MITLVCDRCEKPFAVDPDTAGPKAACPHCGDIKLMPAAARVDALGQETVHQAPDRAAAMGLPPRDGPEAPVMLVKAVMWRSYPLRFGLLAMVAVLGPLGAAVLAFTGSTQASAAGAWGLLLLGLGAAGTLGVWKILTYAERLEVTTKRIRVTRGLLSRSSIEMLHRSVQDMEIDQTLWQRVLRTGTLRIANAGEEEDDITVRDVPNPHRVRDVIDAYRPM